jgi:hypothetical protein
MTPTRWRLIAELLILSGLVSARASIAQPARIHPAADFIARAPVTNDVAFGGAGRPLPFIRAAQPVSTIGSLDGATPFVFGRISDVEFINDSTIAVLEGSANEVRVFTVAGEHLQTFGRTGSGPGEFQNAVAVTVSPKGEIVVADLRKMVQFFRRGPRGFEYIRSVTLPFGVRSMCYLGSRLYVNGADIEGKAIIRALDDSGRTVAEFGEIYESPNSMINYQIAQGRIICDEARRVICYMPASLLGEVRAFRSTGELLWRVRVTDFLSNRVTEEPGGGMGVQRSPNGAHAAGGMLDIAPVGLIAQWTFMTPEQMKAKEAATQVHSVLIDPVTGKATSLGIGLPLLRSRRGDLVLEQTDDPIPQIIVRRYTAGR